MSSNSSTEKENKSFDEILVMQCYGAEDTFTVKECKKAVREWLEQKKREAIKEQIECGFAPIVPMVNVDELIRELSL
jgi:hypothetical protein